MKGVNMKSLNYTQDIFAIEDPAKSLLMLMGKLGDKKMSHLEKEVFYFPNK